MLSNDLKILKMISGRNGVVIWEFLPVVGRYKDVSTPQWIADASGDGIADLLVTVNLETEENGTVHFCSFLHVLKNFCSSLRQNFLFCSRNDFVFAQR